MKKSVFLSKKRKKRLFLKESYSGFCGVPAQAADTSKRKKNLFLQKKQ
jgi:hypothetical protein